MLLHISNRIRLSLYLPYTAPLKYQALSIPSNSSNLATYKLPIDLRDIIR